jgi:hypothetical protein
VYLEKTQQDALHVWSATHLKYPSEPTFPHTYMLTLNATNNLFSQMKENTEIL